MVPDRAGSDRFWGILEFNHENTNATSAEAETALARVLPNFPGSQEVREEIAALAYHYWQEREAKDGSPDEDWFRAEKIVHNRLTARTTAY